MPWKEPGKGDRDPWKSGDQQPPDLEEIFRNVSSRLQSIFGGGSSKGNGSEGRRGATAGAFTLVLLLIIFWVAWDSVHIIDQAEQGVVLRFGKYSRTLDPGINVTLPGPFETVTKVNVSNVRVDEDRGHMLTQDENLVEFIYKVQYRINNAQDFLFKVRDPELTLRQAAESALRESVGTNTLDDILEGTGRARVRIEAQRVLQETLDRYQAGIQVTEFNLVDVNVPLQVRESYSDVIRAREDRQRFIEEARVYENSVIPEARGKAARIEQEAAGYKASTIALATGETDRFKLVLDEYRRAPDVTRKRLYLETMETVLGNNRKVFLDVDSSGNILYLPLDQAAGSGPGRLLPPVKSPDSSRKSSQGRSQDPRSKAREGRR
ncbi:MAG: FtsH protease activity modulator HflK [Gammaproteobacteria bacterium]|nr:MAG: FtsH protease activity modulator HflK [Gammaproteobacteria bacterium]